MEPVLPSDRQIDQAARAAGGVYTLAAAEDAKPHSHERRLRELQRLGLATPDGPQRWKVSPKLLEDLAKAGRDAPVRHRLLFHKEPLSVQAQVRHPGPVWLDRVQMDSLAPYGFGAELRRARLRRLGVQPDDPDRIARLHEVERRAVGEGWPLALGRHSFRPSPTPSAGRVQVGDAGQLGSAYAVVSDGQRFVLLRTTPALRAMHGRTVHVTRDAKGRLVVRPGPDRDMGL